MLFFTQTGSTVGYECSVNQSKDPRDHVMYTVELIP